MSPAARVLYENSTNQSKNYPLHDLICAMVDDLLGRAGAWYARKYIVGMPRKGRDKLLRDCDSSNVERAFGGSLPATARFALVDGDKLATKLALPANADFLQLRTALATQYPDVQIYMPDGDHVQQSNTEGLLAHIATCLGLDVKGSEVRYAVVNKDLIARDKIFAQAAASQRAVRDCFRTAQPSIAAMVDALAKLVGAEETT